MASMSGHCVRCGGGLGGGMKGYCAPAQRCLGPVTTVATINLKLLSCQRLAADVALSLLSRWPIIPPWRHIQSLYVERESGLITFWEISFLHPNLGLLPHVILFVSSHSPLARCCLCEIWWLVGGAVGWSLVPVSPTGRLSRMWEWAPSMRGVASQSCLDDTSVDTVCQILTI